EGLNVLADADHLQSVRKLTMRSDGRSQHHIGEAGIAALADSATLIQLTHLGFRDCTIDGVALDRLAGWDGATGLLELDLSFTDLRGEDVLGMASSRRFPSLRRLCLSAFEVTDDALRALANPDAFPSLRELWIEATQEYGDSD